MPWARTKLLIQDDLLKPRTIATINFTGKNPEKFYDKIPNILIRLFRLTPHEIQEKKFGWHKGEKDSFEATWEVNKDLDRFSFYWVEVALKGNTGKGEGGAKITIEGALRTEYPQDTIWERSILYEMLRIFYHNTLYASTRERYFADGRRLVAKLADEIKMIARE